MAPGAGVEIDVTDTVKLPVLPLSDSVVLPGMVVPIRLDESESRAAVDAAQSLTEQSGGAEEADEARVLLVPRPDGAYSPTGVIATLEQVGRLPSGEPAVVVRAEQRARIGSGVIGPGAALWVEATPLEEIVSDSGRATSLSREYKAMVISILQQRNAWQVIDSVSSISDPAQLADTSGWASYLDVGQKVQLLDEPDVIARLELLIGWTRDHLAEQDVADKIGQDVREGMEKTQRDFLLRQQLAAIRKELGEDEPDGAEDYRTRIENAALPENVRKAALAELGKLERASDQSPESGWIRTWLDTVLELPWSNRTDDSDDLAAARADPGRRSLRAGGRQGAADRVPGRPRPTKPSRAERRRRARVGRCAVSGRAARSRQDLAG